MKKAFILLLLYLCSFVFAAEIYEVEFNHNRQKFIVQNQSSAVAEITHWIIADVIKSEEVKISPEELEILSKDLLSALNVTYENFCKPNVEFLTKIHNALAKVIAGSDAKQVYEQDISEKMLPYEGFLTYVKKYNTPERLEEFRTKMPTSMQVVIKSFVPQAQEIAQYWLLYRKIISSSLKDYDALSEQERNQIEREWWQKKIQKLTIVSPDNKQPQNIEQMEKMISDTITVKNKLSPQVDEVMVKFFAKK